MGTKVYLSSEGRVVDPEHARISVFDRGFLFGDSVFTTLRTTGGRPLEIGRHLSRLHHSAANIGFDVPFADDDIRAAIASAHRESGNAESYVRVMITRGTGPIMLDPRVSQSPTLVVLVQPLRLPSAEEYRRGISAVIVEAQKTGRSLIDPTIKSANYLSNILALRRAIERAGDDAILCGPDGSVAEGPTSNVFMVERGRVLTPALDVGILPGITRQRVCELVREQGIELHESIIPPDQLRAADEVFATSSIRGIMPVTRLDGTTVGDGTAGPITRRLQEAYAAWISQEGS